jgi:trimeric autotransporter adhesin
VVNTVNYGTTLIQYLNPVTGCGPQSMTLTVAQMPSYIHGNYHVCVASVDSLTDSVAGGVWTSSSPFIGTVATYTGWLTGYNPGLATITYMLPGNCYHTFPVMVTGAPGPILGTASACPGNAVILSDSTAYGTWSTGGASVATISSVDSVTGKVIAVATGSTTITYSSCGYDTTLHFTVNAIPLPIIGKDSVCVGDTILMYDSTNFGIWQSKYDTVATAAAAFGIVTGIKYGLDTVYYRLPDGCYTTKYVFVDSLPAQVTGTNNICPTSTTTLHDVTAPGKWYTMYANIATVDSVLGTVKGVSAGYDTIVYTTAKGQCRAYFPITVNPRPAPIVGDTLVCTYDSVIVTDVSPGGFWTSTNTNAFIVDSFSGRTHTVDTSKDSSYIVYTIGSSGCSDSLKIVKRPAPHPVIYYNGGLGEGYTDSIYLGHHISSFQWYDSTTVGKIPGAISCALAFLYNEAYYVIVTDTFGCQGRSMTYFNSTAGVDNVPQASKIVVYPNPTSGKLHILSAVPVDAEIINVAGAVVARYTHTGSIDVSNYAVGTYVLNLYDADGKKVFTEKFVKE